MKYEAFKQYSFYVQVGYVTLIASLLTLLVTQGIKWILKKKEIIYEGMEASKKDQMLSRIGRIVALVAYTGLYLGNELYLHHTISFDEALVGGLLSGGTFTLTIAKGLYTTLHQWSQKKNIYERLEYAEKMKTIVEEAMHHASFDHNKPEEVSKSSQEKGDRDIAPKKTWILTHQKEQKEKEKNEENH